jgi:tRNA 2-thiouridine synthesizing protein B
MATLHLLSHSPFADDRLASCLRLLGPDDALLLSGDAVYALLPASEPLAQLTGKTLFALEEDLSARHISAPSQVQVLDYPGFVACCTRYAKVNSWL